MPGNQDYSIVVGNSIPFGADNEFANNKVVILGVVVPADTENTNVETIVESVREFLATNPQDPSGGVDVSAINAALSSRVRFDESQTLTEAQLAIARATLAMEVNEQAWGTPGSYTFKFPTWAKYCDVLVIAGGQSGGAGCKWASGINTSGGIGGCPGQMIKLTRLPVSLFGYGDIPVTVGSGGATAVGVSTDNTPGTAPNKGQSSSFSSLPQFTALAATFGQAASTAALNAVNNGFSNINGLMVLCSSTPTTLGGAINTAFASTVFATITGTAFRPMPGCSGAGIPSFPSAAAGGFVNLSGTFFTHLVPSISAGIPGGAAPGNGLWIEALDCGLPGGGGASSITGSAQDAGLTPANAYGTGGSGGGSCLNGAGRVSGAGSRGGDGYVRVRWYA